VVITIHPGEFIDNNLAIYKRRIRFVFFEPQASRHILSNVCATDWAETNDFHVKLEGCFSIHMFYFYGWVGCTHPFLWHGQ
jgi:hypothetical protein